MAGWSTRGRRGVGTPTAPPAGRGAEPPVGSTTHRKPGGSPMVSPRYRKLAGDLRAMPGRVIAMVLALAVSLSGVGAALGARTVLRRTIATSYLSSHPADATIELAGDA